MLKKWSSITQKTCDVNLVRSLKYVRLFFNNLDQRNRANVPSQIDALLQKNERNVYLKSVSLILTMKKYQIEHIHKHTSNLFYLLHKDKINDLRL